MLDKDNTLEYNYKILSQERKKKKISQENASTQITLSVSQIKSLDSLVRYQTKLLVSTSS